MNETKTADAPRRRPIIGTIIGDPCGIGPEVTVKAWLTGSVHEVSRPVLIGSVYAVKQALQFIGRKAEVRSITSPSESLDRVDVIDVIDSGCLSPDDITLGRDSEACGRACGQWIDEADALTRAGAIEAVAMAPISTVAMKMAGVLDRIITPDPGLEYLLIFSGPLRVAHLTDHVPLARVSQILTSDFVHAGLCELHRTFERWGIRSPRIGVAGFNPHATGDEETMQIAPAVRRAQAQGIQVEGPISPDTVFRQCIEGRYDVISAMFHDQGHIALKTWGFSGNCATYFGKRPYIYMGTAHGTAFDIVGRGIADHSMMLNAMVATGSLSAGKGFPKTLSPGTTEQ